MLKRLDLFGFFSSPSVPHPCAPIDNLDPKLHSINKVAQTATENLEVAHKNHSNSTFSPVSIKPIENPTKKSVDSKIKKLLWTGLGCWSTYNLIDSGLSRFLVMETLHHGTGPLGYIGINLKGADPNYGGGKTGSSVGGGRKIHIETSQKHIHVFKDTEFSISFCKYTPHSGLCNVPFSLGLPKMHAVLSGAANFGYSVANRTGNRVSAFFGGIAGALTPTLKFRFAPDEVMNCGNSCIFENDPHYVGLAYRTTQPIGASRLGMTGSLVYGVNSDMFNRISANPQKMLLGVALLAAGILVGKKTYDYCKSDSDQKSKTVNSQEKTPDSQEKISHYERFKKRILAYSEKKSSDLAVIGIILNTL